MNDKDYFRQQREDQEGRRFVAPLLVVLAVIIVAIVASLPAWGQPLVGDLDGDGDVDDADMGLLLANWTGPAEPSLPEPEPGPRDDELPPNTLKLGEDGQPVTLAIVQEALNGDRPVALPAGLTLTGKLTLPDATEWLGVWGEGDRPVLLVPKSAQFGIEATNDKIESVTIEGIELRGPAEPPRDGAGIRLRLGGAAGKYAKALTIRNCKITSFDSLIHIADDWARTQPAGTAGRIRLTLDGCILAEAFCFDPNDHHSVGVYVDGLAEGSTIANTVIHKIGWTEDGRDEREKRSHCVYAQSYGAPIAIKDSYLSEPASNGLMMRRGGTVERVVISGAPIAVSIFDGPVSVFRDCAILDQRDIDPNVPEDRRGKAVMAWNLASLDYSRVLIARRKGQPLNQPIVELYGKGIVCKDNAVVAFKNGPQALSINKNDQEQVGTNGNRELADDPGVPVLDIKPLLERQRGQAFVGTAGFIKACWEAVGP